MRKLRKTLFLFSFLSPFLAKSIGNGKVYFGVGLDINDNIVYGKRLNTKFWNFPDAIGKKAKTIVLKREICPGFSTYLNTNIVLPTKTKSIEHIFAIRVGYRLIRYNIKWNGQYEGANSFFLNQESQRHDVFTALTYGIGVKNFNIKTGIIIFFPFQIKDSYKYMSDNYQEVGEGTSKASANKYISASIPIIFSYSFSIYQSISIEPELKYSLGIMDYDNYDMGNKNVSVLTKGRNDQIEIGLIFSFLKNKKT